MENQLSRNEQVLKDIREVIEKNIGNDQFSVSDLAKEVGLSRSMLHRKLIQLTGKSATELITETRLARARELLMSNAATVSEVAYKVGFSSPSYFNKVFKKAYQETPGNIARKGPDRESHIKEGGNPSGKRAGFLTLVFFGAILASLAMLLLTGILPSSSGEKTTSARDKSIVVLPFRNDSPDQKNEYIINGYMAAILNKLSMISDLRVISRESVEQYRNQPDIPEIMRRFKVEYVLSGSGQKYGNDIRITVQLMNSDQETVWSKEYDRRITEPEDHFTIQSSIAQQVAGVIDALITPQERNRIVRIPTASLAALDHYQRGSDAFWDYWLDNDQTGALDSAARHFIQTLTYDSTFAEAYTGLARIYYAKNFWDEYFSENFMDSALSLVNTSLYFDPQLADAYLMRGIIFMEKDLRKSTRQDLNKAIGLNPNSWENHYRIGTLYFTSDYLGGLKNLWKASTLNYGRELPAILRQLGLGLGMAGFLQQGSAFFQQALDIDGDSVRYYTGLSALENWSGNYERSIEYCLDALRIDPRYTDALNRIAYNYMFLGDFEQSYRYYAKLEEILAGSVVIDINDQHRIGYTFWKAGFEDLGNTYFDLQEQYCLEMIALGRTSGSGGFAHYDLAGIYAFRGDKVRAMENLRIFNQRDVHGKWMFTLINDDPLFDNMRDDPEFRQIVSDIEAKYRAEHARVRQWLEAEGLL